MGLTEKWDASVCLFHARLGGQPVPAQFANSRRSSTSAFYQRNGLVSGDTAARTEPVTSLQGGVPSWMLRAPKPTVAPREGGAPRDDLAALLADEWDEVLYAAAAARFSRDLATAKATAEDEADFDNTSKVGLAGLLPEHRPPPAWNLLLN